MAMECDLEDLVIVCEKKQAMRTTIAGVTEKVAAAAADEAHNEECGNPEPD